MDATAEELANAKFLHEAFKTRREQLRALPWYDLQRYPNIRLSSTLAMWVIFFTGMGYHFTTGNWYAYALAMGTLFIHSIYYWRFARGKSERRIVPAKLIQVFSAEGVNASLLRDLWMAGYTGRETFLALLEERREFLPMQRRISVVLISSIVTVAVCWLCVYSESTWAEVIAVSVAAVLYVVSQCNSGSRQALLAPLGKIVYLLRFRCKGSGRIDKKSAILKSPKRFFKSVFLQLIPLFLLSEYIILRLFVATLMNRGLPPAITYEVALVLTIAATIVYALRGIVSRYSQEQEEYLIDHGASLYEPFIYNFVLLEGEER